MFGWLRSRLLFGVLAFFGISGAAETQLDPTWKWTGFTERPAAQWARQLPVQSVAALGEGLKIPVAWTVARLAAPEMPWYSRLFAETIGSTVLYAAALRLALWRLKERAKRIVG